MSSSAATRTYWFNRRHREIGFGALDVERQQPTRNERNGVRTCWVRYSWKYGMNSETWPQRRKTMWLRLRSQRSHRRWQNINFCICKHYIVVSIRSHSTLLSFASDLWPEDGSHNTQNPIRRAHIRPVQIFVFRSCRSVLELCESADP